MLDGLRVFVNGEKHGVICPDHPTASLETTGKTSEGHILWKCSRCNNSAHWQDDATREAEILALASQASSRKNEL